MIKNFRTLFFGNLTMNNDIRTKIVVSEISDPNIDILMAKILASKIIIDLINEMTENESQYALSDECIDIYKCAINNGWVQDTYSNFNVTLDLIGKIITIIYLSNQV